MNFRDFMALPEAPGQSELARDIGVAPSIVWQWIKGLRPIPLERCAEIERITGGQVTRSDLRPDDWEKIWPELRAPTEAEPAEAAP